MMIDVKDWPDLKTTQDTTLYTSTAISGGSATGKTYSALLIARGITGGKPFGVIDTENKRALHYQRDFPDMVHFNFSAVEDGETVGYPPERWRAALRSMAANGLKACVIDSFSHAWEGINGVLELADQEQEKLVLEAEARAQNKYAVDPSRFNETKWVTPKRRYRRLIEEIIQAPMHIIICIRAKPVRQQRDRSSNQMVNARDTKLRRNDLPWDIAADRDLVFEMTQSLLMVPEHPGEPILLKCPDHFRSLYAAQARVGIHTGKALAEWAATGGELGQREKKLLDDARSAARGGKAALQTYWKPLNQADRAVVHTIMDELMETATRTEAATGDNLFPNDEQRFADAEPDDMQLTEDERQRAIEEAAREAAEQWDRENAS